MFFADNSTFVIKLVFVSFCTESKKNRYVAEVVQMMIYGERDS